LLHSTGIASHVKLPRSIDIETINQLIQNLDIVSTPFTNESIIGFLENTEEATCSYSYQNINSTPIINSVLQKKVKSSPNDGKQIKHASTELLYKPSVSKNLIRYQDIFDFIQDKSGTPDEAVVLCCMKKTNNPVTYKVVIGGPLDTKAGKSQGAKKSESCDLMFFGPVYSSLHADVWYTHRNSLIPSWNHGVVKFWIIRKDCKAVTNSTVPTCPRTKESKAFQPIHELITILSEKEHYCLLIQRPGQLIRHYGRHVHCVITAIDATINPTGFSLSIGRKDAYSQDTFWYCSGSKERLIAVGDSCKQVTRSRFLKENLTDKDIRELGKEFVAKKDQMRIRKKRKKAGFQPGNSHGSKRSSSFVSYLTELYITSILPLIHVSCL